MSEQQPDRQPVATPFDGSFEGTRRRQMIEGLRLDHAARLRWLEERLSELLRLKGKAVRS
jgi:hypothetical protein